MFGSAGRLITSSTPPPPITIDTTTKSSTVGTPTQGHHSPLLLTSSDSFTNQQQHRASTSNNKDNNSSVILDSNVAVEGDLGLVFDLLPLTLHCRSLWLSWLYYASLLFILLLLLLSCVYFRPALFEVLSSVVHYKNVSLHLKYLLHFYNDWVPPCEIIIRVWHMNTCHLLLCDVWNNLNDRIHCSILQIVC